MTFAIPEPDVRLYAHVPEAALSFSADRAAFTEATYDEYCGRVAAAVAAREWLGGIEVSAWSPSAYLSGDIVLHRGRHYAALADTSADTSDASQWRPIRFDTRTDAGRLHQDAYELALAPLCAYRILRGSIAGAVAPIQGGVMKGAGRGRHAAVESGDRSLLRQHRREDQAIRCETGQIRRGPRPNFVACSPAHRWHLRRGYHWPQFRLPLRNVLAI